MSRFSPCLLHAFLNCTPALHLAKPYVPSAALSLHLCYVCVCVCVGGSLPVNVPHPQSMRRTTSHNYSTPRYYGPSSPKIDLLPADSKASDSQDMPGG